MTDMSVPISMLENRVEKLEQWSRMVEMGMEVAIKQMQADITALRSDVGSIRTELVAVKNHIGALVTSSGAQDETIASLTTRVERIERRLEISDGH